MGKEKGMAIAKQGPNVDLGKISGSLDRKIEKFKQAKEFEAAETLSKTKSEYASGGEVSIGKANEIRRTLDSMVKDAYLGNSSANPVTTQARQEVANAIRAEIARQSPELAALLKRQSLMLDIEKVLSLEVTKRRKITNLSFFGTLLDQSRTNIGVARSLRKAFGTQSQIISPAMRQGSRSGLIGLQAAFRDPFEKKIAE